MHFYEFNGSLYIPKFTIATNESVISEINIFSNGSKFIIGGSSKKISTYTFSHGAFGLLEQFQTGVSFYEIFVDPQEFYFLLATTTPTIEVLFRCPEVCSVCSFPSNCTSCVAGYHLEGSKCLQDATHCVQNKFVEKDICEEYCDRSCKTCNFTRTDCVECS